MPCMNLNLSAQHHCWLIVRHEVFSGHGVTDDGLCEVPVATAPSEALARQVAAELNALCSPLLVENGRGGCRHTDVFGVLPIPALSDVECANEERTEATFTAVVDRHAGTVRFQTSSRTVTRPRALDNRVACTSDKEGREGRYSCVAEHPDPELARMLARSGRPLQLQGVPQTFTDAARTSYRERRAVRVGELTIFTAPSGHVLALKRGEQECPASVYARK